MAVECDRYGFFNGVMGLEQANWGNYWYPIFGDAVLSSYGDELEPYAVTGGEGMYVRVKTGQAIIAGHRVWVNSEKKLAVAAANASNPRKDTICVRVVYGNTGETKVYLDVKTGTPSANPTAPSMTQNIGTTWEYSLGTVDVPAGTANILPENVRWYAYVGRFNNNAGMISSFSTTSLNCSRDKEYRCTTALSSLTIGLPYHPYDTFITSVRFPSASSFSGVTIRRGTTTISGTSNLLLKGDSLNLPSKIYELVIWWDGSKYWCASAAA